MDFSEESYKKMQKKKNQILKIVAIYQSVNIPLKCIFFEMKICMAPSKLIKASLQQILLPSPEETKQSKQTNKKSGGTITAPNVW